MPPSAPQNAWRSEPQQKKAARFPKRPFLSHGGAHSHRAISDLPDRGPISRSSPSSAAAAFRDSRELFPEPNAMVTHLRKMGSLSRIARAGATPAQTASPLFPLSTAMRGGCLCIHSNDGRSAASRASRAGSRRSPSAACRWRGSSLRAGRPSPCRSDSAGAAFPTRAAGN